MIVRHLPEAIASGRRIQSTGWESTRLVLKNDNAGFSFHITTIYRGAELPMHNRNHIESVYCISGSGEIETVAVGKIYPIAPGTIYVLDQHDQHILRAETEMVMACVFNPPLHGTEVHDADGVYPLEAEAVTD